MKKIPTADEFIAKAKELGYKLVPGSTRWDSIKECCPIGLLGVIDKVDDENNTRQFKNTQNFYNNYCGKQKFGLILGFDNMERKSNPLFNDDLYDLGQEIRRKLGYATRT